MINIKICVYAICKNEEKNILKWYESMKEADDIYVLDTGSTDGSVKILKSLNVHVKCKKIIPFRFDNARNESFKMIKKKYDLYVCTDIDERFNKGWRQKLENSFNKNYTRVKYLYNWSFDEKGKPATTFYLDKIHTKDYVWIHPVHEVLRPLKDEKILLIEGITLNHYQDKLKSRSNYLPLLKLSVKESPDDDRNLHYLAREYMYYNQNMKAIKTFHRHLNCKNSVWKDERSASMRFMARCYQKVGYKEEAIFWFNRAINESPYLREAYVELASLYYNDKEYEKALELLNKAFLIKEKSKSYINEPFAWNGEIYDLYAVILFYLNKKDIALKYSNIAISLSSNERILNNNKIIKQVLHEEQV